MVCANILQTNQALRESQNFSKYYDWMAKRKVKSFYTEVNTSSFRSGAVSLMQCVGLGKFRPNTLMMGFKNNWLSDSIESTLDYYGIINDAFNMKLGICILKLANGLDYSDFLNEELNLDESECDENSDSDQDNLSIVETFNDSLIKKKNIEILIKKKNKSYLNAMTSNVVKGSNGKKNSIVSVKTEGSSGSSKQINAAKGTDLIKLKNTKINQGLLQGLNMFHRKEQNGFVDVWWLYDDGGLTLLLPYLLLQRKCWKKCKLRIFIQTKGSESEISEEQRK